MFTFPPGLGAPPGLSMHKFGTDTPDPPPMDWVEDVVDGPGAGSETPVQPRSAGIDYDRLSRKLSQLQGHAAAPALAGPGAPALAKPATVDCTRLSREVYTQQVYTQQAPSTTISIGTVGHPTCCSAPCEYVNLPGGCPDGTMCKKCHLCGVSAIGRADAAFSAERGPQEVAPGHASDTADKAWPWCPPPPAVEASIGSRGHPTCCAEPCKYRKRKGGCRNGADCPECHLCHWRRQPLEANSGSTAEPGGDRALLDRQQPAAHATSPVAQSVGTPQHANQFVDQTSIKASPLASELPDTHFWSGPPPRFGADPGCSPDSHFGSGPPPGFGADPGCSPVQADPGCPTKGSMGHPLCCGPACKYANKKGGCKDGYDCLRCHLCQWRRYQARQPPGPPARGYQLEPLQHPGVPPLPVAPLPAPAAPRSGGHA